MIKKLIKKIERRKFYFAIKGFRKLVINKNLSDIKIKQNDIAKLKLSSIVFSPLFFSIKEEYRVTNEIILRQYLIQFLIKKLYFAKLRKLGGEKFIFPKAPKEWLYCFEFKYNKFSNFVCYLSLSLFGFNRILKSIKILINIVKNYLNKKNLKYNKIKFKETAYFYDLHSNCFPKSSIRSKEMNLINWYLKWPHKLSNLKTISGKSIPTQLKRETINKVSFEQISDPIFFNGTFFDLIKLTSFFFIELIYSIILIFGGNMFRPSRRKIIVRHIILSFI